MVVNLTLWRIAKLAQEMRGGEYFTVEQLSWGTQHQQTIPNNCRHNHKHKQMKSDWSDYCKHGRIFIAFRFIISKKNI